MKKSVFETLSAINVNDKVEKKNGLTYLSWAWAWGEVKKAYPSATYEVVRDPQTDKPYFADPHLGIMVMTNVCIDGQCLEMWLPVMNHRNQALTVDQATMFDVNKAIMRCLTKNLAMFGLGHYIYVGEDYPQTGTVSSGHTEKTQVKDKLDLRKGDSNWKNILEYIASNKDKVTFEKLVKMVEQKYNVTATVEKNLKEALA